MSLNEKIRVTWNDLEIGRKLRWDIYADSGKLLLKAGHVIANEQVLEGMCKYVLYRYAGDGETAHSKTRKRINVFAETANMVLRLKNIFADIDAGDKSSLTKLEHLVDSVWLLCRNEADATIAALHLPNDYPYSIFHSIQCAIVYALIIQDEGFAEHQQKMIVAAALTANVGMHALQDQLATQDVDPGSG